MPGENLTRTEAIARRAVVDTHSYDVELHLTTGDSTFRCLSTVKFAATSGASTFIDAITERVESITLNGRPLDPATASDGVRIQLDDLADENELTIVADMRYTNTGEGLHRFVDPVDGEVYLYSQFEVPDSRRMYPVFEQPDLKAVFTFTVTADAAHLLLHHRADRRSLLALDLRARLGRRSCHSSRRVLPGFSRRLHGCRLHLRQDPPGLRVL